MQQRGKLWKWNMDIWRTQLWNERRLCVRSSRQRIRSIEINIFDTSVRVSCETSWHFIDECHSSHSGPIHCEIRIFSSCALNRIRPHIGSMKLMPPRINCPSDADAKFSSVSSIPLPTAFFLLDYPFYLAQTRHGNSHRPILLLAHFSFDTIMMLPMRMCKIPFSFSFACFVLFDAHRNHTQSVRWHLCLRLFLLFGGTL